MIVANAERPSGSAFADEFFAFDGAAIIFFRALQQLASFTFVFCRKQKYVRDRVAGCGVLVAAGLPGILLQQFRSAFASFFWNGHVGYHKMISKQGTRLLAS